MKGFAYLDSSGNIGFRTQEYIDSDNPYFFKQNSHLVIKKWQFDTEDASSMQRLLRGLVDLNINGGKINEFCASVGFLPKTERNDAGKI